MPLTYSYRINEYSQYPNCERTDLRWNFTVINSTKEDPGALTFVNQEMLKAKSIQVFAMSDIHVGIYEFKIALFFDHPQFFSRYKDFNEGFPD